MATLPCIVYLDASVAVPAANFVNAKVVNIDKLELAGGNSA
jgi:hypothetical protein